MSGQVDKQCCMVSTPTISHFGINNHFDMSSQDHWFFRCPHCSKLTELIFPECLEITGDHPTDKALLDTFLKCKECNTPLDHDAKIHWLGEENAGWVPSYTDRMSRGFYINQLYSMTVKPWELAASYLKGLTNPEDETEFFNSKLGLPHEVEGSRVTDTDLLECEGDFQMIERPVAGMITMGIDVGKWIHYEIDHWTFKDSAFTTDINLLANAQLIKAGKVLHFEELDQIMQQYAVSFAVCDANPERRKAFEFAQRFYGHVKLCFYGSGITSKELKVHSEEECTMSVDRTSWMDVALGRFRAHSIALPKDLPHEYKEQVKAPVRRYEKDKTGNPVGRYITPDHVANHYAHARTYAEIALQFGTGLSQPQNITGVL
tara:strand:- start:1777 stop:2901 length:1125 start_codon:yes stop_codon:yes gene_type:complete